MNTLSVTHVVGARPNLMKAAPVMKALAETRLRQRLIHTGQHYDKALSALLFDQLRIPQPDINLNIGSATHAQQTAAAMVGIEADCLEHRPAVLIVYGDVNSSLAGALVAAKMLIPSAHVEAGVRSFDRTMPEELNRIVIDRIASCLLTPSPIADENLRREGVPEKDIHCVGNVMTDALMQSLPLADAMPVLGPLGLDRNQTFALVTLHRPATVDDPHELTAILNALSEIARQCPVIFPVHPRTRGRIAAGGLHPSLHLIDPVGYLEFIGLQQAAAIVITDSGGVQVETSFLGVPCLTYRDNTEWQETLVDGTNELVGRNPGKLVDVFRRRLGDSRQKGRSAPSYWDGMASNRIAAIIARMADNRTIEAIPTSR